MFVKRLQLLQFRNYERADVRFEPGTNVIYGRNARGKTNLLEGVFLLSTARSHRFAKEREMILFGCDEAKVKGCFESRGREFLEEISFFSHRKKQIKINGAPLDKASLLMGYFNVVMFCPEELRLVKGSPRERRKMLDLAICQLRRKYFHALIQYSKILEQRNHLLKNNPESEMLWVWNEKLAEWGSRLIWFRAHYLEKLKAETALRHKEICGETLELSYQCGVSSDQFEDEKLIYENFLRELEQQIEREKRLGMSLVGPHRDDFKILINGKDAKIFASQGQQRTAALSLKLAEVELIAQQVGENPVLLLDDVLSELDESRQDYILNYIKKIQVIITCTDKEKFYHMKNVNQIDVESVKQ